MVPIIVFALFSTRRQEVITRIQRADLDVEGARILVRDMKNPGQKIGNDQWCDLPTQALATAQAMPTKGTIFPYGTDAISASFTRACSLLGTEDLHFHVCGMKASRDYSKWAGPFPTSRQFRDTALGNH